MPDTVAGITLPDGDPHAVSDAAAGFRRLAGGFDRTAGVANRALAEVPSWVGVASMTFRTRCGDYGQAAHSAGSGCAHAAQVLASFADELSTAREEVKRLQARAQDALTALKAAEARADDAMTRYGVAGEMMHQMSFLAPADAGAARDSYAQEMQSALDDQIAAENDADAARTELDGLRRRAHDICEETKDRANAAAGRIAGIVDQLPAVKGGPPTLLDTVTSSHSDKLSASLQVLIFTIGGSESALVERHADGKWTVTTVAGLEGGLKVKPKPGVDGETEGGGKTGRIGEGPDLEAALVAQFEKGKTYEFDSKEDALKFVENVQQGEPVTYMANPAAMGFPAMIPNEDDPRWDDWEWSQRQKPVETYTQGGFKAEGQASLDFGAGDGASIKIAGSEALGTKTNEVDNTTTEYFKNSASVEGGVTVPGAHAGGKLEGESVIAVKHDGSGAVTEFSVTTTGTGEASAGLDVGGDPGKFGDQQATAVRHERQVTLNLSDPGDYQAVQNYLHSGGVDPQAALDLNRRLAEHGETVVRNYTVDTHSQSFSANGEVVGVSASHETTDTHLTSAYSRPPGADEFVKADLP